MALGLWARGVWKHDGGDIALSGITFLVSVGIYVYFYSFTVLEGVPGITMFVCGAATVSIVLLKGNRPRWNKTAVGLVLAPLLLGTALLAGERQWTMSSNSLLIISPYRIAGTWAFDDPRVGLQGEPFVSGAPEMIDKLVAEAKIPAADKGFRLIFSSRPFPGYQAKMDRGRTEAGGRWYSCERLHMEGWLCPALFKYFKRAPKEIYLKAEPK